jgi:mannose-1-phosphate guanylyltransferase/phosphomannomutase
MKVAILAGGKGERLGLVDKPKPMVSIAGRPLLEHIVDAAKASGFRDFVFLTGHLGEVIEQHFGDGSKDNIRIAYSRETTPLGTGGAVLQARDLLKEPFLLLYGDILLDVDLRHFADFHRSTGGIASLFVHPNDHPVDSDLVEVDETHRINRFLSKPHVVGALLPNLVSAAMYVLDPSALDFVPRTGPSDWGKDVFPAMIAGGKAVFGYRSVEYAKDMGTPERLAKGKADIDSGRLHRLSRRQPKPAIFLDRDGVINREINGVHRPEDLQLLEGAGAALALLNQAGLPAICITNQPDVAKGKVTPEGLRNVFCALDMRLAEHGSYIDDLYHCPHHPERGWPGEIPELKIDCDCRKPKPGMLLRAAAEHNLDLKQSWFIGDRYADVAAARAAGTRSILVMTGHAGADKGSYLEEPDFVARDLGEAVKHILDSMS